MSLVSYFSQKLQPKIKKQLELACRDIEFMGQQLKSLERQNADQLAQLLQSEDELNASILREKDLTLKLEVLSDQKAELVQGHNLQLSTIQTENELTSKKLFEIEKEHEALHSKLEVAALEMGMVKEFLSESENEIKQLLIRNNLLLTELDQSNISLENSRQENLRVKLELQDRYLEDSYEAQKKIEFKEQENSLLIHQMQQLQEVAEDLLLDREKSAVEVMNYKSRWNQLRFVMPEYIHHDEVKILSVEDDGNESRISWQVINCDQMTAESSDLYFHAIMKTGVSELFLEIVSDDASKRCHINPQKLLESARCKEDLLKIGLTDFRKMCSAILILEWVISRRWKGVEMIDSFDPNFWQSSLLSLIKCFKRLPQLLRWDGVSLLQEVCHIDYENLWIELVGVQFGLQYIPRVEIRIGAALLDPTNFSRHPKFEFPLVGKERPFSSWYEESTDDLGPKFEVRYSLDEKAIDIAVLRKLELNDRELVINIINSAPKFLTDLMNQGISINRPWIVWMDFTTRVCELNARILGRK